MGTDIRNGRRRTDCRSAVTRRKTMENKNYYREEYLPGIIKYGKITDFLACIFVFVPALIVTFYYGIIPAKGPFMVAIVAQLSVNAVWWVIEPVSFFPVLGIPGSYMAFLSGNNSNLRMPCAAAALKATDTQVGTDEGSIISTIGVGASVFVNIVFLIIGVLVGAALIAVLPSGVKDALNYLLPALFGAVFAQFAIDDWKTGIVAMGLGVLCMVLYNNGMFNWLPIDPFVVNVLVPIFGTMIYARIAYKPEKKG